MSLILRLCSRSVQRSSLSSSSYRSGFRSQGFARSAMASATVSAPPLPTTNFNEDISKLLPDPRAQGKQVIEIIMEEHRLVDTLFQKYQTTSDPKQKTGIAHNIIKLLSIHGSAEEMSIYPFIKTKLPNGKELIDHAIKEHSQMKQDLYALDSMDPGTAEFDAKFQTLVKDTQHHVKEEESNVLPSLKKACTPAEMQKMTDDFISMKAISPSRPHPDAPTEPPANKVANTASVPLDAARDIGRFSG